MRSAARNDPSARRVDPRAEEATLALAERATSQDQAVTSDRWTRRRRSSGLGAMAPYAVAFRGAASSERPRCPCGLVTGAFGASVGGGVGPER
jgi:hypothetical protein